MLPLSIWTQDFENGLKKKLEKDGNKCKFYNNFKLLALVPHCISQLSHLKDQQHILHLKKE
jgi:hypothetical protein